MQIFYYLIKTIVFICFPLLISIICIAYNNNLNKKEQDIIHEVAILSSFYLTAKFIEPDNMFYLLFINIPLLMSFLRKSKGLSLILSLVLALYYHLSFDFNLYLVLLEYMFYYVFFLYFLRKKLTSEIIINCFSILKGLIIAFEVHILRINNYGDLKTIFIIFLAMTIFYILSYGILFVLKKGKEAIELNKVLKELENERIIKNSLFKITHEIKNPIAVCKGYLDMMDYNNPNQVEKYSTIIKSELNRSLVIMDDFVDYSRIKIKPDIMDIILLLEDVTDSMISLFKINKCKLIKDIYDDEVLIYGDYDRLKQALVNIIKNAIEASKDKKSVHITTKLLKNNIIIKIKDNGVGIKKEDLDHIGELFYTTKEKGTGLGISLSKEIINAHDGELNYESTLGKGTEVTIKLPIKN
jgi:two-component system sporulation sensor kinase B